MNRSDEITSLAAALSKAQGEMEGASKDKENPHFRSKYADLGAVWDAIREPLSKHGLSVTQWMRSSGDSDHHAVEVETMLLHESGEWLSDTFAVPVSKVDAQGYGSACTYARRYSLMAAVGIAPVDDDANAAVGGSLPQRQQQRPPQRNGAQSRQPAAEPPAEKTETAFDKANRAIREATTPDRIEVLAKEVLKRDFPDGTKLVLMSAAMQRLEDDDLAMQPNATVVYNAVAEMKRNLAEPQPA